MRKSLLHRVYGAILLLNTLGPVRGDRQKAEIVSDEPGLHDTKLRQHFRNALAYVCAFDTGSDQVTAIALDAQPSITNVLIAANRGVPNEVVEFLRDILSILRCVALDSPIQDTSHVQDVILRKVVTLGQPRIRYYHKLAVEMYESCLEIMQGRQPTSLAGPRPTTELYRVQAFLDRYFSPNRPLKDEDDCLDLVKQCHGVRGSGMIEFLNSFAANGQLRHSKFQRLQELLKKLGKHVTCSRRLVNAANNLPREFTLGFEVKHIGPSPLVPICLPPKKSSVEGIIDRMIWDKQEQETIKEQLKQRRLRGLDEIAQEINALRSVKTQTHAELLLIDYIEQHEEIRVTNDKYIGCSKPACYLCHLYIRHHPGNYSLPDTSNKLYVKWRIPDIDPGDKDVKTELTEQAEEILDLIIQDIRRDFRNDLKRSRPRNMHADSSADMTTTVGGPDVGAGVSAGLQPGISRYLESLTLNDSPSTQESTPTPSTPNYNYSQNPFTQHHQPYLPLYGYPPARFEYPNPYLPQPFYPPPLLMTFARPIPEIPPSSAALSHAPIPTPSFPYNRGRDNGFNNNRTSGSIGERTISLPTSNITRFSNDQEQQVPSSQGTGERPKWRGPPSRRWVSARH
ncbi:hypothetical protein BDBG_03235 [Blastomyces gilchristii SLH14081]|uniref:Uncharacterized protein n=1 Tax=Blastomyces gilchristii (strain SLH14081) TaxID=559298 RepID=A0A179UIR4_BLAGS|nr:uncharacterized protein BDBG_03235 [Blastomyces gilchristii SLH14081]OAT07138.1 hypothetical protein BDBG_03235 [Blastomyces gilchristii SLH14081]